MTARLLVVLLVIAIGGDQVSKAWSEANLLLYQNDQDTRVYQGSRLVVFSSRDFVNFDETQSSTWMTLQLNYVRNHGAAWGSFSNLSEAVRLPLFHALTGLFCLFFLRLVFSQRNRLKPVAKLALILMISGAIGNLIDRLRFGYVVDLIDFRAQVLGHKVLLPVFNVADMCVVGGLSLLIFSLLRR